MNFNPTLTKSTPKTGSSMINMIVAYLKTQVWTGACLRSLWPRWQINQEV